MLRYEKIFFIYRMTSLYSSYSLGSTLPNPAEFVVCTYTSPQDYQAPFPWRFNKQTQALDLEFINGFTASTNLNENSRYFRGQQFRALHNVLQLGPNFIAWCESGMDDDGSPADAGSVELVEKPIVCYANVVAPTRNPDNSATQSSSTPFSFENAAGPENSGYLKTMVFLKPLVIKYTESGTVTYRYFTNNFEGNT
jgi:hypothetical protein